MWWKQYFITCCVTLQQPHNTIHRSNATVYRMFVMFVSRAAKWIQVSFCRLGKTGAAIWLLHNLDVWINIQLDKYNVGLKLRSLLLAACRQFNPLAVHFALQQHNKPYLEPSSPVTDPCMWVAFPTNKHSRTQKQRSAHLELAQIHTHIYCKMFHHTQTNTQ